MGLRGNLRAFVEEIIPPEERSSNPLIYRTAFLRIALLLSLSFIGALASFMYAVTDLLEGDVAVSLVELLVGSVLLFTPFIARKYGNIDDLATVAIVLFGLIFLVAVFDELPKDTASLIWINVFPALAFVLKGRKGVYWAVGYLFVHVVTSAFAGKLWMELLLDAYLSYLLITVIFYFYAWMSERYREVWERLARTDNLTGILSRIAFEEILTKEVKSAKESGQPLVLAIFDIDDFKRINDTYGHPFGDSVIRRVASIASQTLRSSDFIGRWGGEEFIILMPDTRLDRALVLSEKIRKRVQAHRFGDGIMVTASFGLAELDKEDDTQRLILKADKALYTAKKRGKNRVVSFDRC